MQGLDRMFRYNRTFVELKLREQVLALDAELRYNRTYVELKLWRS